MARKHKKQGIYNRTFYYGDLIEQMKKTLEGELDKWATNRPFNDVPGAFTENAIYTWIDNLMKNGRIILRIAHGLSIINDDYSVTEEHINQAIEAYKKGIKEYMEEYKPNNIK